VPGFYGKLPSRGDFISRRLPRRFLESWDLWLQQALSHSRQQLGEEWLDSYLTSPLWRLALGPGICGESALMGVLMPSVDRVGRYFPLLIGIPLHSGGNLLTLATQAADWFQQAEQIALAALDEKDLNAFDEQVAALGAPAIDNVDAAHAYYPLNELGQLEQAQPKLLEQLLLHSVPNYSLWWSSGSEHINPCLLICEGLPAKEQFAALLVGDWQQWGWHVRPLFTEPAGSKPIEESL